MQKDTNIKLKNELSELNKLNKELEKLAGEWHFSKDFLFNINLALEELVTNIISYGYDKNTEHYIYLKLSFNGSDIHIRIEDNAKAFNPVDFPEPDIDLPLEEREIGGLGIFFAKNLMDDIKYERKNDRNILILKKCL